jgi:hypothetical protein
LVNPLVKSLPKSYLSRLLNSTRVALTKSHVSNRFRQGTEDRSENSCVYYSLSAWQRTRKEGLCDFC